MNFVYPTFLFALSIIAIPIIIHLVNLRRYKKVYFSNVSLLQQIQTQSKKRQQLREWLILAARILFISFLVLAFAQPFISKNGVDPNQQGPSFVSIYIDNSFSMEKQGVNGTLLSEAIRSAETVIKAYKPEDKFQILTNDFSGNSMRFMNRDEALSLLPDIQSSASLYPIQSVVEKQFDLLKTFSGGQKIRSYLISDFAKNFMQLDGFNPDSSLPITAISVLPVDASNIGFDSIWAQSPNLGLNIPTEIGFRVVNSGDADIVDLPIRVYLNGDQKTPTLVSIPANSKANGTINFSISSPGIYQGYLELDDASMSFDDRFYFSFEVNESTQIQFIKGSKSNLKAAQVFEGDPLFSLEMSSDAQVDFSKWSEADLLVLSEVTTFSSGWGNELEKFFENGGVAAIFPDPFSITDYSNVFKNLQIPTYGIEKENVLKGGKIHAESPFFKGVFESNKKNWNDVPSVKKYFSMQSGAQTAWEPLFTLANGDVILAWVRVKNGNLLWSAIPLSDNYSDLTSHALFVPILLKSAFNSQRITNLYVEANSPQAIRVKSSLYSSEEALKLKSVDEEQIYIPEQRINGNRVDIFINEMELNSGNYLIENDEGTIGALSVNFGAGEGLAAPLSQEEKKEWSQKYSNLQFFEAKDPDSLFTGIQQMEQGIHLWKWCLILSLIFLVFEILLIRFLK